MRGRTTSSLVVVLVLAGLPGEEDLQPGRNFPEALAEFGTGRSGNIDAADVDLDGDMDVGVSNGELGGPQANRIYVNNGGVQGGVEGTFTDETATRFAGVPDDQSRDIEFADLEGDGDLDVVIANAGGAIIGKVSRFYDNLGGVQGGSVGYFAESTDARWGTLVDVPLVQQVFGGNEGPFGDWSCDCDFGDVDLDGDLDLFHSSYGPAIGGNRASRIFLNDGAGVFDELWPWADPGADIQWHTLDVDLADFDGDFDLDVVVSSRDSQPRFFTNNTVAPLGATLFTDTTAATLLAGGVQPGVFGDVSNYEVEYADLDADGDFDTWWSGLVELEDKLGINVGLVGGVVALQVADPLVGDPVADEAEVDVIDYDGDGDLDVFMANFSGTNWLYRNTLAQSDPTVFQMKRTGFGTEPPELPDTDNRGQTLDGDVADVDGDGDDDLLLANDGNQQNRLYINALGIPDTHAPTFAQVEAVADKPLGVAARVIAQVRDNTAYYVVAFYDTDLVYTVDGGAEQRLDMTSQGGQQFVAFVPGDVFGCLEYRVETTDLAGNTGVSVTQSFAQGLGACGGPWVDLGFGKPGTSGVPDLHATGALSPGAPTTLSLTNALPSTASTLILGLGQLFTPFKGGTLVPSPDILVALPTDAAGAWTLAFAWPAGVPSSTTLTWQAWIVDTGATKGLSASQGIAGITP